MISRPQQQPKRQPLLQVWHLLMLLMVMLTTASDATLLDTSSMLIWRARSRLQRLSHICISCLPACQMNEQAWSWQYIWQHWHTQWWRQRACLGGVIAVDVLRGRQHMQDDALEQKSQLEIMHVADLEQSWQQWMHCGVWVMLGKLHAALSSMCQKHEGQATHTCQLVWAPLTPIYPGQMSEAICMNDAMQ